MEEKLLGAFRGAAVVAGVLAGIAAHPSLAASPLWRGAVLAGLLLFVPCFWINSRLQETRSTRTAVALLAAQLPGCVAIPELFFLVALEAPLALGGSALLPWIAAQASATVAALVARAPRIFEEIPEYRHLAPETAVALRILYWLVWEAIIMAAGVLSAHVLRSGRELARLNAELSATETLLSEGARAAERTRLSREVNDLLGRHLRELVLQLELAMRLASTAVRPVLDAARGLSRRLLSELGEIVEALGPARGGVHLDLGAALRSLTAGIEQPQLRLSLPERLDLSPLAAHVAFRCVQEAVTNALRHASARQIWVELRVGADALELEVRDDGRGAGAVREGHGLAGMRDRVEEAGGELRIGTAREGGFLLAVLLPLESHGSGPIAGTPA